MASWQLMRRVLDLADKTAETLGPFIAGDRPDDPIRGPYHDYTRWVCDSYANIPGWATGLVGLGSASWLGLERSIGQTCRPYLGDGAPTPDPEWTGGQCDTKYWVNIASKQVNSIIGSVGTGTCSGIKDIALTVSVHGPIGAIRTTNVVACLGGVIGGADTGISLFCHGKTNANPNGTGTVYSRTTNPTWVQVTTGVGYANPSIVSVSRKDGLADDCGSLNPTRPRKSPTAPPDPGPNPPGGGQPPTWSPRGPVFHPGPIESPYDEPDSPVPPIDPWNPRGGGPDDPFYGPDHPKPGDPGEPGNSEETTDGGEVDGEVPDGHELVSLLVEVTHSPNGANKYSGVYYRAVCWVFMGNEEGLDMDYAGSMMGDHQLVLAETSGLTHWRVKANLGYSVRVTPFSREVESS